MQEAQTAQPQRMQDGGCTRLTLFPDSAPRCSDLSSYQRGNTRLPPHRRRSAKIPSTNMTKEVPSDVILGIKRQSAPVLRTGSSRLRWRLLPQRSDCHAGEIRCHPRTNEECASRTSLIWYVRDVLGNGRFLRTPAVQCGGFRSRNLPNGLSRTLSVKFSSGPTACTLNLGHAL